MGLNKKMEEEIVRLLEFRGDPVSHSAAMRIEELENEAEQLREELAEARFALKTVFVYCRDSLENVPCRESEEEEGWD